MSGFPPPPPLPPQPPSSPLLAPGPLPRRFVARILDLLLIGLVDVLLLRPRFSSGAFIPEEGLAAVQALPPAYTLLSAALALAYFAGFESTSGATPGKRVMRLRVYAPNGEPPTFADAVKRSLFAVAGVVAVIPMVGPAIATPANLFALITVALTIQRSESKQGWHDRFAGGTQVAWQR